MRKLNRTIRKFKSPQARAIAGLANDLDRQSGRLHRLAVVVDREHTVASVVTDKMVKLASCGDHEDWQPECHSCYLAWVEKGAISGADRTDRQQNED